MPRSKPQNKPRNTDFNWWVFGLLASFLLLFDLILLIWPDAETHTLLIVPTALFVLPVLLFSDSVKKIDWKAFGTWLVVDGPKTLVLLLLGIGLMTGLFWLLLSGIE